MAIGATIDAAITTPRNATIPASTTGQWRSTVDDATVAVVSADATDPTGITRADMHWINCANKPVTRVMVRMQYSAAVTGSFIGKLIGKYDDGTYITLESAVTLATTTDDLGNGTVEWTAASDLVDILGCSEVIVVPTQAVTSAGTVEIQILALN